MGKAREDIKQRVLSSLGVNEIKNAEVAFEVIVKALATISRALHSRSVRAIIGRTDFPLLKSFGNLSSDDLAFLDKLLKTKEASLTEKDINDNQFSVQKLISPRRRKRLAAYYTKAAGLEIIAQAVANDVKKRGKPVILADPFLGSGLTLTETLKQLDLSMVQKVWGVEPHPLPALVAYSALLYLLEGDDKRINVTVGDIFKKICANLAGSDSPINRRRTTNFVADIIVTNPPFTRWELLEDDYRDLLRNTVELLGYDKYLTRNQLNLQLVSLFLMDYILKRNGLLMSVLPASTFYTIYGEAAKSMLREKYELAAFIEGRLETSFSAHTGFKEIIIAATKNQPASEKETAFITIEPESMKHIQQITEALNAHRSRNDGVNWIDLTKKPPIWEANWLAFFGRNELREILTKVLLQMMASGTAASWSDVLGKDSIVRGVEMYGPDFFFIPNRNWNIAEESAEITTVVNAQDGVSLQIPRQYLIPALRKPELYFNELRPRVVHHLLAIPPKPMSELPKDVVKYMDLGLLKLTAQPAFKALGEKWYSHVHKQINVKRPFGRIFLPDKIDPSFRNRGIFACYSETPLTASKNFHIVTLNDDLKDKSLTAWFNSTIFIAYFAIASRRISRSWTRLLKDDYLRMPIINVNSLSKETLSILGKCINDISDIRLPPLKSQFGLGYRRRMDRALLEATGVHDPEDSLNRLYSALSLG